MPHSPSEFLVAIVISACLGALIGLVRQWTDWAEPHRDINFGGARTFTLWAVLGCLAAGAHEQVGPTGFGVIVLAVAAHQIITMARHAHRRSGGTAVINRPLALAIALPFAFTAAPAFLVAGALWLIHRRTESDVSVPAIGNPLSLGTALKFGVLYAIIAFVVKAVREYHWTQGLLPVSFVSGLTNMDAIALSLARGGGTDPGALRPTAAAVLVAILGNTVFKTGVALATGSNLVRRDVSIALGLTTVAGVVAVFVL